MYPRVVEYESSLPVGFHRTSGDMIDFEEARADPSALLPSGSLSANQRLELARCWLERAKGWPEREFYPGGTVDRSRALDEIERGGDIGDFLIDTEVRVAAWVVSELTSEAQDA